MIKLLALDLDGTLLNSRGEIPEKNLEAIQQAEQIGVLVTIATGRRFRDALPVALQLKLNAPVVCHNGALLKYADTLENVAVSLLEKETVREILRVGKAFGGDALLSADPIGKGVLLYDTISAENVPLQKYVAWSKRLHGAEAEEAVHHVENLEAVCNDIETVHVSFSGTLAPMAELEMILRDELNDTVTVLTTVYPRLNFTLIDILPPDASKGIGVEKLALINNLSAENVMAIGDNFNDLEMLEYAGTAIVMGNASPELLERTDFFSTLSNDENGVALAIEKFILGG
ncbi:MAG: HAD family phosphatase [Acidobacteria bacterium]|jgi:Cof subfamily protein (haloacid dehalogenase superfamily)|nr:HAD family phosphatase [Acidobacteriota bacterium]